MKVWDVAVRVATNDDIELSGVIAMLHARLGPEAGEMVSVLDGELKWRGSAQELLCGVIAVRPVKEE